MSGSRALLSKSPINILLNPQLIKERRVWELDLSELLEMFIEILKDAGHLDLRLCGSAALTSAVIYRLKVESLFLFEKLKAEARPSAKTEPPQIIMMPFRYELTSTSIEDLIAALKRVLGEIISQQKRETGPPRLLIEPEPIMKIDPFIAHIRDVLNEFRGKILAILKQKGEFFFSEYVKRMPLLETVRTFLMLLFLATDGVIHLEQVDEEIRISSVFGDVDRGGA